MYFKKADASFEEVEPREAFCVYPQPICDWSRSLEDTVILVSCSQPAFYEIRELAQVF